MSVLVKLFSFAFQFLFLSLQSPNPRILILGEWPLFECTLCSVTMCLAFHWEKHMALVLEHAVLSQLSGIGEMDVAYSTLKRHNSSITVPIFVS